MAFLGGVNDMSTMLTGGRSTFNTSGPSTASAPATTAAATDPNTAAITAAAAALGTTASTTAASPFAATSNLNFSTSSLAPASGGAVGGGVPNPNAVQGTRYAPVGSGMPGDAGGMTRDNPGYAAWHQHNLDVFNQQQATAHNMPLDEYTAYNAFINAHGGVNPADVTRAPSSTGPAQFHANAWAMMTPEEQAQQTQGWDQMTPEQQQKIADTYNNWAGNSQPDNATFTWPP